MLVFAIIIGSLVEERQASEQQIEEHQKWQRQVGQECQELREQRIRVIGMMTIY